MVLLALAPPDVITVNQFQLIGTEISTSTFRTQQNMSGPEPICSYKVYILTFVT